MTRYPLFYKTLMIGFLTILLLVPLSMIESKINERSALQSNVEDDIARSASGPQTLSGPYLVFSYKLRLHDTEKSETSTFKTVLSPRTLKIDGKADVETRNRGIYKARLYNLNSKISGDFNIPLGIGKPVEDIIPQEAYLVMSVSDSRGIRNNPSLVTNNAKYEFEAGSIERVAGRGIHVNLGKLAARPDAGQPHAAGCL